MKPRGLGWCGSPPSCRYAAGHPLAFALSLLQQLASVGDGLRRALLGVTAKPRPKGGAFEVWSDPVYGSARPPGDPPLPPSPRGRFQVWPLTSLPGDSAPFQQASTGHLLHAKCGRCPLAMESKALLGPSTGDKAQVG